MRNKQYEEYLSTHKQCVAIGFRWLLKNIPDVLAGTNIDSLREQICKNHDKSKWDEDEYDAYANYFYGESKSQKVLDDFNKSWLMHIHKNPHHWQHWVLINDDPGEGEKILDMPYNYIIEMICDWWAFSWKQDNLKEIFKWYDVHKKYMKLSKLTREVVENILAEMEKKIDELEED